MKHKILLFLLFIELRHFWFSAQTKKILLFLLFSELRHLLFSGQKMEEKKKTKELLQACLIHAYNLQLTAA